MTSTAIVGFSSTDKVPGYVGKTSYAAGGIAFGTIPLTLLLVGLSNGTLTTDAGPQDVFSVDEARTICGAGTELCDMALKAIGRGAQVKVASPTAAGGAAAGAATITIATTATSGGSWGYIVGGRPVIANVASGDTPTAQGDAIVDAFDQDPDALVSASNSSGVVTLTAKSPGVRSNQILVHQDITLKPSGSTSTLAGGTAVTGGGVPLTGGSGVETMTTLLAALEPAWYQRCAFAQNDATSLAAIEAYIDAKAGPLEGRPEHWVCASNGTLSAATSLAQTTLNAFRAQLLWQLNGETPPASICADFAALRSQSETADPNTDYDDVELNIAPHRYDADLPNRSTLISALNNGVTPITTKNGKAVIVRSITTHSLSGATPDYRTLDTGQAVVPDVIRIALGFYYSTEWKVANPVIRDNPAEGERELPAGVGTPDLWNSSVLGILRTFESGEAVPSKLPQLSLVSENLPVSDWDDIAKRIMSAVPVIPAARNHQIGVTIRQVG